METFEKPQNIDNTIDFKKASEAVRRVKPAKERPEPGEFTEISSLEKARQAKNLERQLKELEEKIEDLKKIADKLEVDYNLAIAEKNKKERKTRGLATFDNLHRVNTEIAYLRGLSEEAKYKIRELKGE